MIHLSSEQIAQWIAGERSTEAERHVAGCPRCRAEIRGLEAVLAAFQDSAESVQAPPPAFGARPAKVWPRLAVVAAALVVMISVPVYRQHQERERAAIRLQDEQLLQQVDAEISRAVPGSMDPLVKLVSWNSGSMESNQNEGHK